MQCCHLEQFVEYDICVGISFHVNNNSHTLSSRLVVNIGNTVNLAFFYEFSYVFYELLFVYSVWYLCHHNLVVTLTAFYLSLSPYYHSSASCLICILHTLQSIDVCTSWEVRCRDIFHYILSSHIWIVDVCAASVYDLRKVVGRNICSHTHGDTITSVDKKIRYLCRHNTWFLQSIVKVVGHYDGIFLQIVHDVFAHL